MSEVQQPDSVPIALQAIVTFDAWCNACGYNLLGLPFAGVCPECGKPVEQSFRSDMLADCEPAHISTLLRGITFVLNGILGMVALEIFGRGVGMISVAAGRKIPPMGFTVASDSIDVVLKGIILYGWWTFSTLDPAYTGRNDASQSRTWIRNLLIVSIPTSILSMVVGFVAPTMRGLIFAMFVVSAAIWIARFFFEMSYVRWLAPRIPNQKAAKRAKLLLWLGPILVTVGFFACGIGPLIALILYWNLLDWVRQDLRAIQRRQLVHGGAL